MQGYAGLSISMGMKIPCFSQECMGVHGANQVRIQSERLGNNSPLTSTSTGSGDCSYR